MSKKFLDSAGVQHLYSKINNKLKLAMEVVDTAISEIELTPGPKGDTGEQGPKGDKGDKGDDGDNGVSVSHSWNDTTLTVISASGTSSANLKGDTGNSGVYIGSTEPQDPEQLVWINPDGIGSNTIPIKGVDYWTDADKAEIETYIDNKLAENDQPQEIFTDVLAEVGYTEKSRINSSGVIKDWETSDTTGYIPVKAGDIIRLKNVYIPNTYNELGSSYSHMAASYTANKTYIKTVMLCYVENGSTSALNTVVEDGGVIQFTVDATLFGENVAYIIIGAADIDETSEIYVNSTIVDSNDDDIPAYWLAELSNKSETIQKTMETVGRNKSSFLWYSDAHWQTNSKMSPHLLKYLIENTPINKINFGGDIINDPTEFTHDNIKYAYEWRKLIAGLPNHHSVYGNHDLNHRTTDVSNIAYSLLLAPEETADMVVGGDCYYYIDNQAEKTRYLYLNYLTNNQNEMLAQGQFIVDTISTVKEGWHIVAIAHRWFQYTSSTAPTVGSVPRYETEILQIFDEYNARTTHTASNYFNSHDFSSGKGKVEFCIGGHIHVDYDFKTDGGIPVIITTSDTNQDRVPDSSVDSGTLGTISESAVYGIVADYDNSTIKVIGVGRGTSKIISY